MHFFSQNEMLFSYRNFLKNGDDMNPIFMPLCGDLSLNYLIAWNTFHDNLLMHDWGVDYFLTTFYSLINSNLASFNLLLTNRYLFLNDRKRFLLSSRTLLLGVRGGFRRYRS